MKSAFRATAVLASSSAITIGIGIISAKVWAVLVGPTGLGTLSVLQSIVAVGATLTGLGVQTGLVRTGAGAIADGRSELFASLRAAAVWIGGVAGALSCAAFWIFRDELSRLLVGGAHPQRAIEIAGIAIWATVLSGIGIGILNAHHRVGALAKLSVVSSVLGAAIGITILYVAGPTGIPWTVLGTALAALGASGWFVLRKTNAGASRPAAAEIVRGGRDLLRFGVPYTASSLVGAGVLQILPLLVNRELDTASVGLYRAANAIAIGYLGFLLTAMAQDYYPRVSAVRDHPLAMGELVDQQLLLLTLVVTPILLVAQVATPFVLRVAYTARFLPAAGVLRWQLVGDLFKFWSWAFGYGILARSRSRTFLFTETVGGICLLAGSWLGIKIMALPGLGVGYLVAYAIYFALTWVVLRREIRFRIGTRTLTAMLLALAAVGTVQLLTNFRESVAMRVVTIAIAITGAILAATELRRQSARKSAVVGERLGVAAPAAD